MINITPQLKKAILTDVLWSVSEFYYCIETFHKNGVELSHWQDEENWATLSQNNALIGYLWQKYPLLIIQQAHIKSISAILNEYDYIVLIESKDLYGKEFSIDTDDDLIARIGNFSDTNSFSANELWFHTVN